MRKASRTTLSILAALALAAAPAVRADDDDPNERGGPPAHVHPVKGARPGGTSSPNMTYHGGKILTTAHTYAIFWGTSWNEGDAKISGLDTFYLGFNGSGYAGTNTEYTDALGTHVGSATNHLGHTIDNSAAPARSPKTSAILAEVCKIASTSGQPAPDTDGSSYYAVYTDTKRGRAGYCAWHSYATCNGTPVQFAFFFNLDGDAGCDPQDDQTGNPQGLAALANVSGHELSEAVTDPALDSWYDSKGAENADKCAWSFGSPFVTLSNGSTFKIQGNWSNAAYTAGTGYLNRSGQPGCLDH